MIISLKYMQKGLEKLSFHIGSTEITGLKTIRNLGTMMDSVINMGAHVTSLCKSVYFQLHNVGAIRRYLTKDVVQLIHSFVTSRLDYCNSLLYGVSIKSQKKPLQSTKYCSKDLDTLWQI